MKQIHALISAATIAAVTALPALAQQTATRAAGESAQQMAQRIDACEGVGISDAVFENNESLLRVTCSAGLSGGLGAAAAGIGVVALIALAADSDGSGSTTTTTTTTTGTN